MRKIAIQSGINLNSYIAGIIDGEGWISIKQSKGRKTPKFEVIVGVENTDKRLIELFSKFYGGIIRERKRKDNWKVVYSWVLGNKKALIFLNNIKPFLFLKKERAEICIEMSKSLNNKEIRDSHGKITDEEVNYRKELFISLRKLNERGIKYV